jgi:site-specific recombinase XerD
MSKANGPEPFYRPRKKRWYVQIGGKQINLGPDESVARQRWHQIMAGAPVSGPTRVETPAGGKLACEVIDLFLAWCQKHREKRTYEWYGRHLQSFLDSLPDAATLPAAALKPFHVENWADARPSWGPNHKRGAITAVQRAFSWAERKGHIPASPVRGAEKPAPKRREQVLTPTEFAGLLARVSDAAFRDVLEFCWQTGARVQEVRVIEAAHYKPDRGRVEIPPHLAKGKKRTRLIYLTDAAEAIVRRLAARETQGPIFRNTCGRPWDAQNFNNRFCRLQHRLGREELKRRDPRLDDEQVREFVSTLKPTKMVAGKTVPKTETELLREARKKLTTKRAATLGTKYALTAIRHSFATRLLEAGISHLTVSALLGHASGSLMLSDVYSHIGDRGDFLRSELLRASHERAAGGAGAA